ncbi:hypothetical protein IFR04_007480 [Cadophora malorum]|uniref:GH16 domain-containing protein n=1 Tax=Cadophora malorum TaxID=108018 RepID=A0A8H7WB00_9HELO|nr:hypothetical protein IFR04_007480 [Cadophora malorum]
MSSISDGATGISLIHPAINPALARLRQKPPLVRSETAPYLPALASSLQPTQPSSPKAQTLHSPDSDEESIRLKPFFRSRRIRKGTIDRPELRERDPRLIWMTIIPTAGFVFGLVIIAVLVWDGWRSVNQHLYCHVFTDDFSNGLNPAIWETEVQAGGYGNGEFQVTTPSDENSFVRDGHLILKATPQTAEYIQSTTLVNLTADGTCTSNVVAKCVTQVNSTAGEIIRPIKSGRVFTKRSAVIRYGRVEVTAKMAAGDWLLSNVMMLPAEEFYGAWPASGEIDIANARGNNYTYAGGGSEVVQSALHWGPDSSSDRWQYSSNKRDALHQSYAKSFHTYGVEWTSKYIFTWVDTRLAQVVYAKFGRGFFAKGRFPVTFSNGSIITNPWAVPGATLAAPFDRPFYLVLGLAVGGLSGWFTNGMEGKPWADGSLAPMSDFWNARNQWLPTWEREGHGEMVIKRVEMWQQCDEGATDLWMPSP